MNISESPPPQASAPARSPQWVRSGSRWTARSAMDFSAAAVAVTELASELAPNCGACVHLRLISDSQKRPTLVMQFSGGSDEQELRLLIGPVEPEAPAVAATQERTALTRVCASWDEAWWITCGLLRALAPARVRFTG